MTQMLSFPMLCLGLVCYFSDVHLYLFLVSQSWCHNVGVPAEAQKVDVNSLRCCAAYCEYNQS